MSLAVRALTLLLLAAALLLPALRRRRAAFGGFVALALFSFALRAGWPAAPLVPTACELLVGPELALFSFRNTPHIVLFALCFPLARRQFPVSRTDARANRRAEVAAFATTLAVGALLELAQGVTGAGHCRLRDLLPDATGALLGWAAFAGVMSARARWWPRRSLLSDRSA